MLFNSYTFLAFFCAVLILHRMPFSWRVKKINLVVASYFFYMAWNPPYVALLWISTMTDWWVGGRIAETRNQGHRRLLLGVSLAINLGLLGFFKYARFALENFIWLVAQFGIDYRPAAPDLVLPLGISFYTFQTLSYTISIYRNHARPARSLVDFALFVTFFPQLVAGPIVRSTTFLAQIREPLRANTRQFGWGLALMTFGLYEKIVLADGILAPVANRVYVSPERAGFSDAWVGSIAFSGQIFFDFAGYSACAIGAALCLGFVLPRNFNCPYAAVGFGDFWRRWHITLSTWLRDYVYLSLLSLFRSERTALAISLCLALTMLLGGLWHGAAWTFVIWGGIHAFYLIAEQFLIATFGGVAIFRTRGFAFVAGLATFLLVVLASVFFRGETLAGSFSLLRVMLGGGESRILNWVQVSETLVVMGVTLLVQMRMRNRDLETSFEGLPLVLRVALLTVPILCIFAIPGNQRAFIYFQF
jgi:alginate O-acetyltransferase complex protein AlgI